MLMDGKNSCFGGFLGYNSCIQQKVEPWILGFRSFWHGRLQRVQKMTRMDRNCGTNGSMEFTNMLWWSPQIWLPSCQTNACTQTMQTRGNVKNLYQDGHHLLRPLQMEWNGAPINGLINDCLFLFTLISGVYNPTHNWWRSPCWICLYSPSLCPSCAAAAVSRNSMFRCRQGGHNSGFIGFKQLKFYSPGN